MQMVEGRNQKGDGRRIGQRAAVLVIDNMTNMSYVQEARGKIHEANVKRQGARDSVQETRSRKGEARHKGLETRGKGQEEGGKRQEQETRNKKYKARGKRQETRSKEQGARGKRHGARCKSKRQEARGKRGSVTSISIFIPEQRWLVWHPKIVLTVNVTSKARGARKYGMQVQELQFCKKGRQSTDAMRRLTHQNIALLLHAAPGLYKQRQRPRISNIPKYFFCSDVQPAGSSNGAACLSPARAWKSWIFIILH
jgi:hypothetical protein